MSKRQKSSSFLPRGDSSAKVKVMYRGKNQDIGLQRFKAIREAQRVAMANTDETNTDYTKGFCPDDHEAPPHSAAAFAKYGHANCDQHEGCRKANFKRANRTCRMCWCPEAYCQC